ncbi:MAG TPA: LysM peptidoglycan-binding domain-containing protein [Bryobacteraceae bacterium]|nr:LysM peptidoglycan-binding domain-containing protein [Bryobacteraceae bacterium]
MDFETVKAKYQGVIDLAKSKNVKLHNVHVENEKLLIKGDAPNQDVKNDVWNKAKAIDPVHADLTLDINIDPSLPAPAPDVKTYTVVAGDSLWRIAQNHLGNGARYPEIIKANPGKLKDENSVIHPGDVLVIP